MNQEDIIKEIINNANEVSENGDEEEMPAMYSGDGLNDDPAKADAAQKRGEELKNQGNPWGAVDSFSQAIQSAQPSAKLLATRGECLLEVSKFKAAQRDCDEALKINPNSAKALRIRGKCCLQLGQFQDALRDFSSAQKKFQEALRDFRKAQEIDFDEDVAKTIKDTIKISAFHKAWKENMEKAAAGNIRVKVPDPIMIEKMNVTQLASLIEQWSEAHEKHIWTFKDNGGHLPGGFELHKYPGRQLEMGILSVDLGHLPSHDVHQTTGYAMFQENPNAPPLTRDEWNDTRNKCAACIEMHIDDCGGIRYTIHEDDFENNEEKEFATKGGFVVYHICDYISMQIYSLLNHTPRTCEGLDTKFPPSCVGIPLFPDFPKTIKDFILLNADYFFLYYGVWRNRSDLPIVIEPPVSERFRHIGMPKARELMHQEDFRDIQKGKQQFFRFCAHKQDQAIKIDFLWKKNVKGYLLDA